jgi:hypothetical protein
VSDKKMEIKKKKQVTLFPAEPETNFSNRKFTFSGGKGESGERRPDGRPARQTAAAAHGNFGPKPRRRKRWHDGENLGHDPAAAGGRCRPSAL